VVLQVAHAETRSEVDWLTKLEEAVVRGQCHALQIQLSWGW
jgi:hypothetical protein